MSKWTALAEEFGKLPAVSLRAYRTQIADREPGIWHWTVLDGWGIPFGKHAKDFIDVASKAGRLLGATGENAWFARLYDVEQFSEIGAMAYRDGDDPAVRIEVELQNAALASRLLALGLAEDVAGQSMQSTEALPAIASEDETAYRPASELMLTRNEFDNASQLNRFLKRVNRDRVFIRTRKPTPQRLEIHAGDWHAWFAAADKSKFDALDVEQIVEDIEARAREVREGRK